MSLRSTSRTTLSGQVINELERLVESGEWPVGTRIPPEPELMRDLRVSRNTLREAVRALVHTGVLDSRPGDGTYVAATDGFAAALARRFRNSEALEILDVRRMIERDAAGMAARRRTADDIENLRTLERRRAEMAHSDNGASVDAELAFHTAIVAAAHNSLMLDLYAFMTDAVRESIAAVVDSLAGGVKSHITLHDQLLASIVAQDPVAAEQAATEHLESVMALLAKGGIS